MSKTDGGAAFPRQKGDEYDAQDGMSLREWFAGQALVGMLTDRNIFHGDGSRGDETVAEFVARNCVAYADAVIAALEK